MRTQMTCLHDERTEVVEKFCTFSESIGEQERPGARVIRVNEINSAITNQLSITIVHQRKSLSSGICTQCNDVWK